MDFFTKKEIEAIDKGIYKAFSRRNRIHSASMRKAIFEKYNKLIVYANSKNPRNARDFISQLHTRAKSKKLESSEKFLKEFGEIVGYEAFIVWVAEEKFHKHSEISNYGSLVVDREIVKVYRGGKLSISGEDVQTYAKNHPKFAKTLESIGLSVDDIDAEKQIKDEDLFIDYSETKLPNIDRQAPNKDLFADEEEEDLPSIEENYDL